MIYNIELSLVLYRKPPTKSPGLIHFRKHFLWVNYGGLIHREAYTRGRGLIVGGLQ